MASFASSATTCGARKHAWTNSINKDHYFVSISLTKKGCTITKSLLWKASIFEYYNQQDKRAFTQCQVKLSTLSIAELFKHIQETCGVNKYG